MAWEGVSCATACISAIKTPSNVAWVIAPSDAPERHTNSLKGASRGKPYEWQPWGPRVALPRNRGTDVTLSVVLAPGARFRGSDEPHLLGAGLRVAPISDPAIDKNNLCSRLKRTPIGVPSMLHIRACQVLDVGLIATNLFTLHITQQSVTSLP